MIIATRRLTYLQLAMGCTGLLLMSQSLSADEYYAGVGLGLSRLNPNTDGTTYELDNNRNIGGKLYLGYKLSERLNLEAYYSDMGEATFSPTGSIGYKDYGLNATYYVYDFSKSVVGLSGYIRGGVGNMMNDATSVHYKRNNTTHFMYGAGAEYALQNGWALRADLDLYDRDAGLFAISLMKRFGNKAEPVVIKQPQPVVIPEPVVEPEPVVVVNPDLDGDGILNEVDICPETPLGTKVDATGCKLKAVIVLDGVVFAVNSDELIGDSKSILNTVAKSIVPYPELRIEIGGYTDSKGAASYNQKLSERRANAVRHYLIEQGIVADNLSAKGYGEERPVADNGNAEGRSQNRRVELRMLDNTQDAAQ